jgi:diacylglycerol kinase family enzyme
LPSGVEVLYTKWPGHAIDLARSAVRAGKRTIVAVGGDGTINKVVNGLFDADGAIPPDTTLAIIPSGTGSDFQRSLRIPSDPMKAAEHLRSGTRRPIDIMRVRYTTMDGQPAVRYGVNVTSFGLGGAVASLANRTSKALGGKASFLIATAISAARFFGNKVALNMDGRAAFSGRITNVAARRTSHPEGVMPQGFCGWTGEVRRCSTWAVVPSLHQRKEGWPSDQ